MASRFLAASMGIALVWCVGCTDTYCQSGPKYGTQCQSLTGVQNQQNGGRPPLSSEPPAWFTRPPPPSTFGSKPAPPPPVSTAPYPVSTAPTSLKRSPDGGIAGTEEEETK